LRDEVLSADNEIVAEVMSTYPGQYLQLERQG
jgi:hypothetical protein